MYRVIKAASDVPAEYRDHEHALAEIFQEVSEEAKAYGRSKGIDVNLKYELGFIDDDYDPDHEPEYEYDPKIIISYGNRATELFVSGDIRNPDEMEDIIDYLIVDAEEFIDEVVG